VVGDNELDASGNHHVHLAKYSEAGATLFTQTHLGGMPADDDYLYHLTWQQGNIYLDGQTAPASGYKYVFGARYIQQ
jgi:hypothetical protein